MPARGRAQDLPTRALREPGGRRVLAPQVSLSPPMSRSTDLLMRLLAMAAVVLLALPHAADAEMRRGRLGFTVYVQVDGSYAKPVLKSVHVQEIEPGSPAEAGGLKVDDEIVQVQGVPLAGANARDVAAMVQVPPG